MGERIIRASEVGEYVYCARAWWLRRVRGLAPGDEERLVSGRDFHAEHGRLALCARSLRRVAILLAILAGCFLLLACFSGGG